MSIDPIVDDEYSGLATLLANLIAKYADVLEFEDEESSEATNTSSEPMQGGPLRASLPFSVALLFAA